MIKDQATSSIHPNTSSIFPDTSSIKNQYLYCVKRMICLVLTVCYLFSSVGVSAKSMYCLGMLRSTTISYSIAPKKAECKMAHRTARKCCTTKTELLKVKDQHTYTGPIDLLAKFFPVLFSFGETYAPNCASTIITSQHYYSNAPPPSCRPVYVLNCSYRI